VVAPPRWMRSLGVVARWAEELVVISLFLAMVVVVSLGVFMRYVMNDPIMWSDIAARLIFTWTTFLGAALAVKYNAHIAIDVVVSRLPRAAQRYCDLAVRLIVAALLLLLIGKGLTYAVRAWPQRVAPYEFSYAAFALAVPVSATVMLIHTVGRRRDRPPDDPLGGLSTPDGE
jgi:TRAP-type C4-dicarboxylate transport system permease small subunit